MRERERERERDKESARTRARARERERERERERIRYLADVVDECEARCDWESVGKQCDVGKLNDLLQRIIVVEQ